MLKQAQNEYGMKALNISSHILYRDDESPERKRNVRVPGAMSVQPADTESQGSINLMQLLEKGFGQDSEEGDEPGPLIPN